MLRKINLRILLKVCLAWFLTLLLVLSLFFYDFFFSFLDSQVGFLFEATFEEFKSWYPNFYFIAYPIVKFIPFVSSVLLVFFIWKKKGFISEKVLRVYKKPEGNSFDSWQKYQVLVALIFLLIFLVIYFTIKIDFNFQLNISRIFLIVCLLQFSLQLLIHRVQFLKRLNLFLLKKDLPYTISILRISFFLFLMLNYISSYFLFINQVSLSKKEALPFIGWLIDILPVNSDLFQYSIYLGMISCLFIVVGYKTRFFLILNGLLCFYIIASPNFFGKLWHNQIFIWISWIFMLSRCYDVFSIDAYLKKTKVIRSANYTFPIRIIWLHFGLIYFWAGFYKMWDAGFDWALSKSMVNQVQLEWLEAYDTVPWIRIDAFPFLLYFGGLLAVLFEMSYFFLLFNRFWRYFAAVGGIVLHQLIGFFMYISFLNLQILYFFFINFNLLYKKKYDEVKERKGYSKYVLYFCMVIFGFNLLAGMFNVNSYPFSSYPNYSEIVPDKIKLLEFKCEGCDFDVHAIGKKNNFRWENYGRIERQIIFDFEKGEDVKKRLEDYWEVWRKYNSELEKHTIVDVYIQERPVSPEGKEKLQTIAYICKLHIQP